MIKIYDLNRQLTAILENAFAIGYSKEMNTLSTAQFTMPADDEKIKHVKPLHYAEIIDEETDEYIGLFRIQPKKHIFSSGKDEITFELEDVLGTLFGKTLFKYHQFTNYTTKEVITGLLGMQNANNWVLGDCDFTRYFHYSFENENLLNAILSVPETFDEAYVWETDTTGYPWVLHLRKPETSISNRVIQGYNLQGFSVEENPNAIWNRIYPLGSGEGVNQLTIESVNGGVPYVEDATSIAKYGLYETTWADKRFTDKNSLKSSALALIEKWGNPIVMWDADVLDVSILTGIDADKIRLGRLCRITLEEYGDIELRVIAEKKTNLSGDNSSLQVTLGSSIEDLGTTQTDLERRQQVNELYSQGATNIMNFSYQDNCDNAIPAVIPFYIDDDVVNVNTIELTYRTKKFRAYSGVTKGGGSTVKSTSSGGGSTATSSSGGGVSKSTESGGSTTQTSTIDGQSSQTSSAGGDHRHLVAVHGGGAYNLPETSYHFGGSDGNMTIETRGDAGDLWTYSSSGNHSHSVTTPAHSHGVTIPSHIHEFSTPNHVHNVTILNHTHEIDIPDHAHEILHKIVEAPNNPSGVIIKVDGNTVPQTALQGDRVNLAQYASKDTNGNITRGRHEITITPNTIARIEADLILRVFIRSQLGGQL